MNDKNHYHKYCQNHHLTLKGLSEQDRQTVQEELNYLQMRLRQIGYNGDCAYEKKLAVYYDSAILRCKEQLAISI